MKITLKTVKRIIAAVMAALLLFSLASCKTNPANNADEIVVPEKKVAILVAPEAQYPEDYRAAQELAAEYPDTIVVKDDGTVVLQFGDRDSAQNCSDYLNGLSEVAFAEADAYIDVPIGLDIEPIPQMDNSSWGERYINADKYAYYLENNNFNSNRNGLYEMCS